MSNISKLRELDKIRCQHTLRASLPLDTVYLNVPKCGCTTVKRVLWEAAGGGSFDQRLQFQENVKHSFRYLPKDLHTLSENPFVFTIVRNPFSRIFSAYFDKVFKAIRNPNVNRLPIVERDLLSKGKTSFSQFLNYIEKTPDEIRDGDWRSMKYQTNADFVKPDFIGSVEGMAESLSIIRERIGLEVPFKNTNQNTRHSVDLLHDAYYDDLVKQVVRIYKDDFLMFGYSTDFADFKKAPVVPN